MIGIMSSEMDGSNEIEEVNMDQLGTNGNAELLQLLEENAQAQAEQVNTDVVEADAVEADAVAEEVVADGVDNESEPIPTTLVDAYDENLFVQLGDTVRIVSDTDGEISGIVYYRGITHISIRPFGTSTLLVTYEFEDDEEEERYKDKHGITEVNIIKKREAASFVEQQLFHIGQRIDTVTQDKQKDKSYIIHDVNRDRDFIIVKDASDALDADADASLTTFEFDYIGIPTDLDFVIITSAAQEAQPENIQSDEVIEVQEEPEEEDLIEVVGTVTITLPTRYRQAKVYEQYIPDALQKVDALNDFIAELSSKQQHDPNRLRDLRILVETLFYLKQATVSYHSDGTRKGIKAVSATTLVDLVDSVVVPLGRPVLGVTKKVYITDEEEEIGDDDVTCVSFNDELERMIDTDLYVAPKDAIAEWSNQRKFLQEFAAPWTPAEEDDMWTAITDTDFFREMVPEIDEDGAFSTNLSGYVPSHSATEPPVFDKIPFGLERSLSTTYRNGKYHKKEALLSEEKAPIRAYLLFPLHSAAHMGKTRTYQLAMDSGLSQIPRTTMTTLLRELGTPIEGGTSKRIQLFDPSGGTLGNIPLADYIAGIDIQSLTIHDVYYTLLQFGMDTMECTIPLYDVLVAKMDKQQRAFRSSLATLRQAVKQPEEAQSNYFIETLAFMDDIEKQPLLAEEIETYKQRNPSLLSSDIGIMSAILKHYANYVQVTAGQKSLLIAKATETARRLQYVELERIKKALTDNAPYQRPQPNKCKHVATLATIRKKRDDTERFQDLTAFFKKFQGSRNENWIDCNSCNKHLLCIHERLQIQGFLQPTEKAVIDKEIIISFSGGQFNGQYICRNCGQPIRDFEFDHTVEFDDNGRPKSGHAVLQEDDEQLQDDIDMLVSAPVGNENAIVLDETTSVYYSIIRKLSEYMEIEFSTEQVRTILDRICAYVDEKIPSKRKFEMDASKKGKVDPFAYDAYRARIIISICVSYILIEIQCAMPSYRKKYKVNDTIYELTGYPLDTDDTNLQTIQYMSIALFSRFNAHESEYPWKESGMFKMSSKDKISAKEKIEQQLTKINTLIMNGIKSISATELVAERLHKKRRYAEVRIHTQERLPLSFLPEPFIGETVIVPEVAAAANAKSRAAIIMYWIRMAHIEARNSAILVRGSTFAETTCCRRMISDPIWKNEELPDIGQRSLAPKKPSTLLTMIVPRNATSALVAPNEELYYRLFLSCCSTGIQKGHSHQLGLTNQCIWCGFQFPGNPDVIDSDTEGKAALVAQNVDLSKNEFATLLNTIHILHSVQPIQAPLVTPMQDTMAAFSNATLSPVGEWKEVITTTLKNFMALPNDADKSDSFLAASEISNVAHVHMTQLTDIFIKKNTMVATTCEAIIALPWSTFCDVLQTYFIVPFQRKLSNFSKTSLHITYEMTSSLSKIHVKDDLQPILTTELAFYDSFSMDKKIEQALRAQLGRAPSRDRKQTVLQQLTTCMKTFIAELSVITSYKNKFRVRMIPYKERMLEYIKKLILYGSFRLLFAATTVPANAVMSEIVIFHFHKFNTEKLSFDEEVLRNRIESRNEKERVRVIKEMDMMDDEERAIELMNKRHGIGKWAVGGTKVIYAYDKDYYDRERQKRLDAGITDFPASSGAASSSATSLWAEAGLGIDHVPQGKEVDELGFGIEGDEDGYEQRQHADDDEE